MMHTSSRSAAVAVAMGALMLLPARADAQLGGFIKKKVGGRVADKVLGAQGGERAPKFSETVLEIDSDRLDQLVRGVGAEVAAYKTAMAPYRDHEAAMEARQNAAAGKARCEEAATAEYSAMATGLAARATAGRMPMPTPTAAGGTRVLNADATRMEAVTNTMQVDLATCPKSLPPEPERPEAYGNDNQAVRDSIAVAAVRASGLTAALGPTLPEMTAILGALGAREAVFLDGGISAQLAVRDAMGAVQQWSGLRSVPLALTGRPAGR